MVYHTILIVLVISNLFTIIENVKVEVVTKPRNCKYVTKPGDYAQVYIVGFLKSDLNKPILVNRRSDGNTPLTFYLGRKEIIQGLDKGLMNMCIGESRKLEVPPEEAFGDIGLPPTIPGGATIIYHVELWSFSKPYFFQNMKRNDILFLICVPSVITLLFWSIYRRYKDSEMCAKQVKIALKQKKRR